jgi:putative pyruvate formate lyase activating enzyme
MSQYYPTNRAFKHKELDRKITPEEYKKVVDLVEKLGIENGWVQGMESAESFRPDFTDKEPFSEGRKRRKKG